MTFLSFILDASYEQLRRICVYVLEYGCELHSRKGTGDLEEETNDVRLNFYL